jgi:hypothetical protein
MWIKRQRYKRSISEPIEAAQLTVLIVGDGTRVPLWHCRVSWSSPANLLALYRRLCWAGHWSSPMIGLSLTGRPDRTISRFRLREWPQTGTRCVAQPRRSSFPTSLQWPRRGVRRIGHASRAYLRSVVCCRPGVRPTYPTG